jgi:acyl carrier protein
MTWNDFARTLAPFAKVAVVAPTDVLFGEGLGMNSIRFLEFILALEDHTGTDIDVESLGASIRTAGQLHAHLFAR